MPRSLGRGRRRGEYGARRPSGRPQESARWKIAWTGVSSLIPRRVAETRGVAEGRLGETSDLEGGGLRSRALGILGRLYGTTEGEAHGILVGVGPSLHCSRRLIHCRLPQTAFCPSRLSSPLLRSPFYRRRPSRVLSNVASPNRLRDRSMNDRSPILRGWPAFSGSLSSTDDCGLPSTVFAFFSFWSVALEFFFPFSLSQDRFVSRE